MASSHVHEIGCKEVWSLSSTKIYFHPMRVGFMSTIFPVITVRVAHARHTCEWHSGTRFDSDNSQSLITAHRWLGNVMMIPCESHH